jgi:SOS-response transcriptional repressor LexA
MPKTLSELVNERLTAINLGPVEAATRVGLERNFIADIVAGKKKSVRGANLIKLASALDCSVAYLTGESADPEAGTVEVIPSDREFRAVPVVGMVEAGTFREVDEFGDLQPRRISVPRDERYPRARQFAFDVAGDSMNAAEPPITAGAVIVCVDFDDVNEPIRDGMRVVVERTRDGGHLREWSVKEVRQYEDRVEFIPRSTNAKHRPIVVPRGNYEDEGTTVRILALVRMTIWVEN